MENCWKGSRELATGSACIRFFIFGEVPRGFVNKVLSIIEGFTSITGGVDYLEVYFYRSTEEKLMFLESEALELGVIAIGDFIAMHEAWRGWPRVHIDYEKSSSLCDRYLEAVVVHEASHAVLHGSPLYYSIAVTQSDLADIDLGIEDIAGLLYLASTVVKDIDVHRLLVDIGMASTVRDYLSFLVEHYGDTGCRDIEEILQLAKILTPCIFLEDCPMLDSIPDNCLELARKIIASLEKFRNNRSGDISRDTVHILRQVKGLIKD